MDKGHRGEWEAFARSIREGLAAPIAIDALVNSTLASFALLRAANEQAWVNVDSDEFLAECSTAQTAALIQ
jgi:hypothetical protein